eukprot:364282-Chlamydomonas_euryale.AAC.31
MAWTEAERLAGRQAGREACRQAGREAGGQTGREAGRQTGSEACRQTGREAGRQTGREAGRQTGSEAGRQTGREAGLQTGRQAGKGRTSVNLSMRSSALTMSCMERSTAVKPLPRPALPQLLPERRRWHPPCLTPSQRSCCSPLRRFRIRQPRRQRCHLRHGRCGRPRCCCCSCCWRAPCSPRGSSSAGPRRLRGRACRAKQAAAALPTAQHIQPLLRRLWRARRKRRRVHRCAAGCGWHPHLPGASDTGCAATLAAAAEAGTRRASAGPAVRRQRAGLSRAQHPRNPPLQKLHRRPGLRGGPPAALALPPCVSARHLAARSAAAARALAAALAAGCPRRRPGCRRMHPWRRWRAAARQPGIARPRAAAAGVPRLMRRCRRPVVPPNILGGRRGTGCCLRMGRGAHTRVDAGQQGASRWPEETRRPAGVLGGGCTEEWKGFSLTPVAENAEHLPSSGLQTASHGCLPSHSCNLGGAVEGGLGCFQFRGGWLHAYMTGIVAARCDPAAAQWVVVRVGMPVKMTE